MRLSHLLVLKSAVVADGVHLFDLWQADGKLPKNQQRGYRGVFHALYRIAKDEGVLTYWRGGGTTGEPTTHLVVACALLRLLS